MAAARRKPPASLDSYDCVLRAYEYSQVHTKENHFAARQCLENAIELDSDYTDAWAWLAYLYGEEFHHQWNPRPESYDALDKALEVAEHAVNLDQTSQVAHAMLGTTYRLRREFERFRVETDRAIAINPNNALLIGLLGSGLTQVGDWERGVPLAKRAFELNPNPPPWIYMSFFLDHYRNRRYEAALVEARRTETVDYRTKVFRAAVFGQLGRTDEAQRELSELREQFPGTPEELRRNLIEQYGFPVEMTDHLMEGLAKAGLEID
jgi:adenylate cyclase